LPKSLITPPAEKRKYMSNEKSNRWDLVGMLLLFVTIVQIMI